MADVRLMVSGVLKQGSDISSKPWSKSSFVPFFKGLEVLKDAVGLKGFSVLQEAKSAERPREEFDR